MLESARIYYRPITREDLTWLIELRVPDAVNRYMGGREMQNAEAITSRLPFYLECHEKYGFGFSTMTLKETGEKIGTSGLQPLGDTGEIEVGYNLAEKYWRQGFGYECAFAWLKYGFETAGLERIVAVAHPDNTGSWKIMEKCGMRYEQNKMHYGMDCVFYAISREDFLKTL
ncbi:MAG: GNAT family N-acetyltransferase [Pyrinomonadaceae bacterium]|nr:GNAT family N-acetyltransferase [Pyrinomonadaceae bacterium]MBP9108465.1 GNAT family N-acetyltransferase [Pyrinomonadaceae bacterium]